MANFHVVFISLLTAVQPLIYYSREMQKKETE